MDGRRAKDENKLMEVRLLGGITGGVTVGITRGVVVVERGWPELRLSAVKIGSGDDKDWGKLLLRAIIGCTLKGLNDIL